MEFEVPKRHSLRPTLSTDMVQWVFAVGKTKECFGSKRQGPMAEKCCYNKFLMNFFFE